MRNPKFLSRYLRVQKNELPARFRITDSIPVEFAPDMPLEGLWELHDRAVEKYRLLLKETDAKARAGIKSPAVSVPSFPGKVSPSLLDLKIAIIDRLLESCSCCERRCGINRIAGEKGYCRLTDVSRYASEFLHMGEEPELVPSHTIFFTGCVFSCVYCQNWDISTCPDCGIPINAKSLAGIIDRRREQGARNVNFVTPTPHPHTVLKVMKEVSVNTPVVWNSNMYHSKEIGKILEGVVDVYLGDFKYGNDACAQKYSKVKNYLKVVQPNFETAYKNGEILLRHLVLPGHLECCTKPIVEWVKEHIPKIRFNLMFQYRPCNLAMEYPQIARGLTLEEQEKAIQIVTEAGLEDVLI